MYSSTIASLTRCKQLKVCVCVFLFLGGGIGDLIVLGQTGPPPLLSDPMRSAKQRAFLLLHNAAVAALKLLINYCGRCCDILRGSWGAASALEHG
jgi:hypothetical protein